MPFNFNLQNPLYTFGFGGKYPKFTKKVKVKPRGYTPRSNSTVPPSMTTFPHPIEGTPIPPSMTTFPHPIAPVQERVFPHPIEPIQQTFPHPVAPEKVTFPHPPEPTMVTFPHPVAPSYTPNQTPSDIFQQYRPRMATGMEQMRGLYGIRGLPYGYRGAQSPKQYQPRYLKRF